MNDIIVPALKKALELIFSRDPEVYATVYRSLYVTGLATLLSCLWSIPIAAVLGLYSFRGKWVIKGIFSSLIGVPTVALGLLLYLLMSHMGEFGSLHLLYTLNGIAIGESILVTPLIVSFTSNALGAADIQLRDLSLTLGASRLRTNLAIMRETIWSMVLAVSAAFNRGFGELGVATIVGGNLAGLTRVLTTTIAFETNEGYFDEAMAYAIILMAILLSITLVINFVEWLMQTEMGWPIIFRIIRWNLQALVFAFGKPPVQNKS
ncbi:MAG TPA: ABC transporter permease [Candidatus Acidoferrum sp.]|nr:ABC transporter permease [Candidatus Acidoferrum sp.]